ncbi:MAG: acyl-CoA dehydrogenase family protein [Verrucomicrobia bacterium]|nr:acyl-CoA dehydrogenase family protein [Verrucomicrobiota bacterium]
MKHSHNLAPEALARPAAELRPPQNESVEKCKYPPVNRRKTAFDPRVMQQLLDGEFSEVRNLVKQRITKPDFQYYDGTDVQVYRRKVLDWLERIAETGIGRIFMPRYVGGEDNLPKYLAKFETLAFHDTSLLVKAGVQFGLFAASIQRLGVEYHHRKYLPDAAAGRLLGGFAMTEIGHGSNVQRLETTAFYDRETDAFVIDSPTYSAGKTFIGNAGEHGQLMTVFAQLEVDGEHHGVHAFLVPIRDDEGAPMPGVTIEGNGLKMGLNGVDNGKIWFKEVRVPRTEMLTRFAEVTPEGRYRSDILNPGARFFTMIGTLVGGRISMGLGGNSAAKSALTIAVRYAARRRQFGPPKGAPETLLLDYPSHQLRLMPLLANVYALDFALKHLIQVNEGAQSDGSRPVETLAAGLKAYATWNTSRTIQTCREACGGEGYLASNRFAALKADTDIFTTFEGDNTVLMQLAAKNLLAELKDKLKQGGSAQLARFSLDDNLNLLAKRHPAFTQDKSEPHLLDSELQLDLFRLREDALLVQGATELQKLTSAQGLDPYSAFTQLQPELLELAQAYIERVILEQFIAKVKSLPDQSLQAPLKRLCDLFALTRLEQGKGWYLENGVVSGVKSTAFKRLVTRLCVEVSEEAVALVDAFGIPDECLAAPIAL